MSLLQKVFHLYDYQHVDALQHKSDEMAGIIDAISRSQAMIEFDLDGKIITANDNFLGLMGYRLTEIQGQHHSIFVDPTYRASPEYRMFWEKLRRGDFDANQYCRVTKGGKEVWIQATYNPVRDRDGKLCKVVKLATDITEQKVAQIAFEAAEKERLAAEEKLATANARIRAALDNVTTNVMIADNNRDIIYMNRSVSEMLLAAESDLRKVLPNFDARKLIGTSMDGFHRNPAHQRDLLANLRTTYKAQIAVGGRTFSLIANPVFNDNGERLGSVVEWKDRTEEVKVEKEVGDIVIAASNGDFTRRIALEGKEGFFRQLGEGINQLVNTSEQGLKDVGYVLEALSRGDLTRSITAEYQGTFGQLKDYSNNTVTSLTQMLLQIREATETINTAANEIASGNADLSSRTEQQASNLEETASSMEELTSTVKQNSDNARQANQLAMTASGVAQKGGVVVQNVVETMAAINDSARKIADIISVIDGIAFQTNILALNAAVEAARAGEQGRGFAVVAAEVRNLAQRSASAAKEIKSLITDSVEKVDDGNKLVSEAGSTMQEIVQAIKRVTDLMSEIAAASEEQSSGIEQVNTAVTQMDEMTQQNAALVEQASAAAESLREQADTLSQSVAVFVLSQHEHAAPTVRALPKQTVKPTVVPKAKLTKLKTAKAAKPAEDEWDEF